MEGLEGLNNKSSFIPKDERVPKLVLLLLRLLLCSFIPKDERVPKSVTSNTKCKICSFIPKDERVPK